MRTSLLSSLLLAATASALCAAPLTFDFKDPKGVNNVQFHLDAPLESIAGTGSGITGAVTFDPADPAATTGKISVATSSLTVPNNMMGEHMRGKGWLDAEKNPEITFEVTKLQNAKTQGNVTTAEATGKFTLKGVTKEITVPVKLTYLADSLGKRINKPEVKGDLLVVRSEFTIKRSDFDVKAGQNEDRVSDEVKINLSLAGSAAKS